MRRLMTIPHLLVALLLGCLLPLGGSLSAQGSPDIGDVPPELQAARWFNWIGDGPTLESLKGEAVLVHFFVVKEPKKAQWLTLLKFYNDHRGKGLRILAVTRDDGGAVERMLQEIPLPFPVGAGSEMQRTWGANGDYGQVVLDRDSVIFYRTDAANGTWNGKLLKAMRGADRPKEAAFLRCFPAAEYEKELDRAIELLREGKLAKALGVLEELTAEDPTDEESHAGARELLAEVDAHLERLMSQIREALDRREVLLARTALDALAKELKKHPKGEPARELLAELEEDEAHAREVEAAGQYEQLVESFFRRGWDKNLDRFEQLVEDFPETRAAEKMKAYWIKKSW